MNNFNLVVGSFFLYGGYYAFLLVLFSLGLIEAFGFYYSLLVRVLVVSSFFVLFLKMPNFKFNKLNFFVLFLIISFSILYLLKINFFEKDFSLYPKEFYYFYYLSYCFLPFLFISFTNFNKIYDQFFIWIQKSNIIFLIFSFLVYGKYLFQEIGRLSSSTVGTGDDVISPLVLSYISSLAISIAFVNITLLKKNFIFNFITILLAIPSFLLGSSRGSIIVLLFLFLILIYLTNLKNKIRMIIFALLFIFFSIFLSERTSSSVFSRFLSISDDITANDDSAVRLSMWGNSINEFKTNIVFGGDIEINAMYPHNIYIESLMASGILGFSLLIISFFCIFYKTFKLIKLDKKYTILLIFLLNALIQYCFSGALYFAILIFVGMGIVIGIRVHDCNENRVFKI